MLSTILVATLASMTALACPGLEGHHSPMQKRGDGNPLSEWNYSNAVNWGGLDDKYSSCQKGMHQSPIALRTDQGLATWHKPIFQKYNQDVSGKLGSWGYGPQFALNFPENKDDLPNFIFEENGQNETVYLREWHIHAPAEHIVDGHQSRAELHLVHYDGKPDDQTKPRAVISIRIDPGNDESAFFTQMPSLIGFKDKSTKVDATVNPGKVLQQVDNLSRYFTYSGSLTTPPCTENIRWFVAPNPITISNEQMVALLSASQYSVRPEQPVWQQAINM